MARRRRRRGGIWEKPESEKNRILMKWRRLIPKILSKRKRSKRGQNLWDGFSKAFAKSQHQANLGRLWATAWGQTL